MEYLYTIIHNARRVVSLNSIKTAREGIQHLGGNAYIKYNETGKNKYAAEKNNEKD